jgi:hypothetical protein
VAVAFGCATGLPGAAGGFSVSQLAGRTGLCLSGQADLRTAGVLTQAIAALPADAAEIHLQLASLEYIDVAAARELVGLTRRPARPRLVLHYPPAIMLRLLRLCWPEIRAQIDIAAARPDSTWAEGRRPRGPGGHGEAIATPCPE